MRYCHIYDNPFEYHEAMEALDEEQDISDEIADRQYDEERDR